MSEKLWHYSQNGETHGPITSSQLNELATTGQLSPDDLVWHTDMKDWRRAGTVKWLFPHLCETKVSTPTQPPEARKTGVSLKEGQRWWQNLFVIGLFCLIFPPVGFILLIFKLVGTERLSRKTLLIGGGAVAALLVMSIVTSVFQREAAAVKIAQAESLWDQGDRSEAGPFYLSIVQELSDWIPTEKRSSVYGRTFDFLAEDGREAEAKDVYEKMNSYVSPVSPMVSSDVGRELIATIRSGSTIATKTKSSSASAESGEIGTLEELGDAAYENLPFADVEESPDIAAVPLTEDFAKAGTFRFRSINPDMLKASLTPQLWEQTSITGYKERTQIGESDVTFNIQLSKGEPKTMLQYHGEGFTSPIIRIGALPGDQWEWINLDVVGEEVITRFHYRRCVRHNERRCVMIEKEILGDDRMPVVAKWVNWYAEGIGLVKQSEYHWWSSKLNFTHIRAKHRIIDQ
ncbi:DUF4339 domain-containing protein [Bremerella sp. P1]|uniref:DUF4339 domain-containing protein n=1 Tax=Bremerella sp. P1 TaxID=3026424 RepID=UPI0023683FE9|nr:DUF4339 domain-containing protein [Bremerella sp. P1]WDI39880.1 DUF4339 domain-containing protein [Bremerella sp. P1]